MTRRLALAPMLSDAPAPAATPLEAPPEIILVPHSAIARSPLNPRKTFDAAALEELADNIAAQGLMQNLVVRPAGDDGYEIVAGERRWRAIAILVQRGTKPADMPVPVLVKRVTDLELLLSALNENLERRDMHPLEEAEAFLAATKLSQRGDGATAEISERLGKTQRWVQQRIALASKLDPSVKKAFHAGVLNLEQTKAFLGGSRGEQKQLLATVAKGYHPGAAFNDNTEVDFDDEDELLEDDNPPASTPAVAVAPVRFSANDIRAALTRNLMPVSAALFPLEQYTGEYRGEEEDPTRRYFADAKAAAKLQEEALEQRAAELRESHTDVEILRGAARHNFESWMYRPAKKKDIKTFAFLLVDERTLAVAVHEGLALDESQQRHHTAARTSESEKEAAPPEPCLKSLLAEAHRRKTATLQDAIAANPALALRVACLQLLATTSDAAHLVRLERAREEDHVVGPKVQSALTAFVGTTPKGTFPYYDPEQRPAAPSVSHGEKEPLAIWRQLELLTPAALAKLHAALVAAQLRVFNGFDPKLGDAPIAIAIAAAAGVEHAAAPALDEEWLKGYRKPRLVAIAKACGAVDATSREDVQGFSSKTSTQMRSEILSWPTRDPKYVAPELYFGSAKELEARAAGKLVPTTGVSGKPARGGAPAKGSSKRAPKTTKKKARG